MVVRKSSGKGTYFVKKFIANHNHSLVSAHQLYFIRSNGKVSASALATAVAL